MASEEEIIITFLFKRSGKLKLSFLDLYLTLSMDLNWFTPDAAKEFINLASKKKLLAKKGDLIQPNFDYDKIVVPVGFYPTKKIFEEKENETHEEEKEDIFYKIVKRIVEKTDFNEQDVIQKIEKIGKEKNITLEVAALFTGKEYNIPLEIFFEEIENKIFTENKE